MSKLRKAWTFCKRLPFKKVNFTPINIHVLETREADLERERAMIETIDKMIEEGHEVLEKTTVQDPQEKWIEEEVLIVPEMKDHTIEEMTIVSKITDVTQRTDAEKAVLRSSATRK